MIRLVGSIPARSAIAARPGSLKRAAIEAEHRAKRPLHTKRRVDFGCAIPFTTIPPLVEDGFRECDRVMRAGDSRVLEHYHTARQCLAECLGQPTCDVMLMLVLTLASCSVTPTVKPGATEFDVLPKKKHNAQFAAVLVTRMLWSLRPDYFPWREDQGVVLPVPAMTKKIGETSPRGALLQNRECC